MDSPISEEKSPSDLGASVKTSGSGRKNSELKDKNSKWGMSPMYKSSQIKKRTRRNGSPVYWFPPKKNESYLKRKIKHLQEAGGMNLSLDETLENSNLHYTRLTREKIAAQEAARNAMEARKLAMVEASWCRILKAARIKSIEAEMELEKATKVATEAFESAREMGVMMYDRPDPTRKIAGPTTNHQPGKTPIHHEFETTSSQMGRKSTYKITASFETAFEVDRQVAAAVKRALLQITVKESKELLWKISQNPEDNEKGTSLSEVEFEPGMVDTMLVRLKGLKEDEIASLAEIVATRGLNAALSEVDAARLSIDERYKLGTRFNECDTRKKEVDVQAVPSLDKFLVKHMSKLEIEVEEAKKNRGSAVGKNRLLGSDTVVDSVPGLGSILIKRMSKLEREVYEAKRNSFTSTVNPLSEKDLNVYDNKEVSRNTLVKKRNEDVGSQPGLGEILLKHKSKKERAKLSACLTEQKVEESKNQIEDRRKARERELMEAWGGLSLANSMQPRLSRIEREKVAWRKEQQKQGAIGTLQ
ncbi:hypothetical protein FCM35_KLT01559 [Carex littledalei]|uniref:Uncharacterized protein n=1 Tax=Carex littledalei TaxID=544730 RepID=A0A833VSX8_9POAL|nr:hypothetical protein FCM35_KLT01559 [Carex littledalei]